MTVEEEFRRTVEQEVNRMWTLTQPIVEQYKARGLGEGYMDEQRRKLIAAHFGVSTETV